MPSILELLIMVQVDRCNYGENRLDFSFDIMEIISYQKSLVLFLTITLM